MKLAAVLLAVAPGAALTEGAPDFAALESKLAEVVAAAQAKTDDPETFAAGQQEFARARNACRKERDATACLAAAYRGRIADLIALHRLAEPVAVLGLMCTSQSWLHVDFFETDPRTAMVRHAGERQLMHLVSVGLTAAHYAGGGRQMWKYEDAVELKWDASSPGGVSCFSVSPRKLKAFYKEPMKIAG